jgi:hypothetical protein
MCAVEACHVPPLCYEPRLYSVERHLHAHTVREGGWEGGWVDEREGGERDGDVGGRLRGGGGGGGICVLA